MQETAIPDGTMEVVSFAEFMQDMSSTKSSRSTEAVGVLPPLAVTRRAVVGATVHYVLPKGRNKGQCRAAMMVRVSSVEKNTVNVRVLLDGLNDGNEYASGTSWEQKVRYSAKHEPGTWHWISDDDSPPVTEDTHRHNDHDTTQNDEAIV